MEEVDIKDTFLPKLRLAALSLFFLGLFLLSVGLGIYLFRSSSDADDIQIISSAASGEITVDVDGAVIKPGVYKLKADARMSEAVEAAGGLSADVDRSRVNLAAKVADGQKVYVKSDKESESQRDRDGEVSGVSDSGLVNINTASQSELEKLPKIGPVTAQKIILLRPYSSLEELLSKKAVSVSVFENIKDLVTY